MRSGTQQEEAIGLLQRALNALDRDGRDRRPLVVDRRLGVRTQAALSGFLAAGGAAGEARLLQAIKALRGAG